jgi:hypothetical protein
VSGELYDRERAEETLPMLRDMLPRIREARRALIDASERITEAVAADGGGVSGADWFAAQERLRADLTALADAGILLRDPETGLVDFPAERDGERVYLCWRVGEDAVANWHPLDTGFSSRRPL